MAQRASIGKLPPQPRFEIPERPPDWTPTLSEDPGLLQGLLNRLVIPTKRAMNTAADVMLGSTPEEQAENALMSPMGLGTAATTGRREMRWLLGGALDRVLPGRRRPSWSVYGGPPRPVGQKGADPNLAVPFTPKELREIQERIRNPYLQEPSIPRLNESEWDDAQEQMGRVKDDWAGGPTERTRRDLDEIGRNTEFGRHYLDRLHELLREVYPSGQVPLYRGMGKDELETILRHGDWLSRQSQLAPKRPEWLSTRSSHHGLRVPTSEPMLQSFSLSPNMARSFTKPASVARHQGTEAGVLYGGVPIENIRGHIRSPTMQEEELIVDVLPRRRDLIPDWKVGRPRRWDGPPPPHWGKVRHATYWQNVFENMKVPDDLPRLRGSDDDADEVLFPGFLTLLRTLK